MNRHELVITSQRWEQLHGELFTSDGRENVVFLLCGRNITGAVTQFLMHTLIATPPLAYGRRTHDHAVVSPDFVNEVVDLAAASQWSIVVAHSHPGHGLAAFSPSDAAGEGRLMPVLHSLIPVTHATLLLTRDGWAGHLWADNQIATLDAIHVRGRRVFSPGGFTESVLPTFERQSRIWGSLGQGQLSKLKVGIVGVGGTGSCVAEQLTRLGVADMTLIDPDVLEESNRSRMYGVLAVDPTGTPKVDLVKRHVQAIMPGPIRVQSLAGSVVFPSYLGSLRDRDVVMCCTDTLLSRAILNRFAYQYLIPVIDMGVRVDARHERIVGAAARVTLVGPELACLRCSGHLKQDRLRVELLSSQERNQLEAEGYIQGVEEPQPAVISLNSMISSLAVTSLLNLVQGWFPPQIEQVHDVIGGTMFVAQDRHASRCDVCGAFGLTAQGDRLPVSTFEEVGPG